MWRSQVTFPYSVAAARLRKSVFAINPTMNLYPPIPLFLILQLFTVIICSQAEPSPSLVPPSTFSDPTSTSTSTSSSSSNSTGTHTAAANSTSLSPTATSTANFPSLSNVSPCGESFFFPFFRSSSNSVTLLFFFFVFFCSIKLSSRRKCSIELHKCSGCQLFLRQVCKTTD